MKFLPFDKMLERVERAKSDSDSLFFEDLLLYGEMLTKMTALGLASAIADDRQRERYRILHKLVRFDGIGDWAQTIGEILKGTAAQHLLDEARDVQQELTQRLPIGSWQYEAVSLLNDCLKSIDNNAHATPTKIDGLRWFSLFAELRNKTRGHGALLSQKRCDLCSSLAASIECVTCNYSLFLKPWAYLYRNLSGKYRVTPYVNNCVAFDSYKSAAASELSALRDGVYIHFGGNTPQYVELIQSNVDASDFFLPNGGFTKNKYERISYISGDTQPADATPYLIPADNLPASETQGKGKLEIQGKTWGNIPFAQHGYVRRVQLEDNLYQMLTDNRHPIVTLQGRGGIGKTWLALTVLHRLAEEGKFEAIIWFSARDIDLLSSGPKNVAPHVLTESDMAKEFVRLLEPSDADTKEFKEIEYLSSSLTKSPLDGPTLFVFDNFETVRNPVELFTWLDTYIRLPNKVLITTRINEFKADYPVNVSGMSEQECVELISKTAPALGISDLLNSEYVHQLINESEGHPYVIKVLLGEVAKAKQITKVERIVASRDEILDALFERTYAGLSPAAKRIFLTLCSWRSTIPQLALEAVLLKNAAERIDVPGAVEELRKSSFIDVGKSFEDNQLFLSVPLVAVLFGKRKLEVSPMKTAIQGDLPFLQSFGAAQSSATDQGLLPRINRLFRTIAKEISQDPSKLEEHVPMLELIARNYPPAWKILASLYEETNAPDRIESAKHSLRRYLETSPNLGEVIDTWQRIAGLCQQDRDTVGEIQSLVELSQLHDISFNEISNVANRLNQLFRESYLIVDDDEKRVIVNQLASVMEKRISEGDATDCSRLSWLFLHLHDADRAKRYAEKGIEKEKDNTHCWRILERLSNESQNTSL